MDEPPFSLAFVMVKESFVVPARLFYLASNANKNKRPDNLNLEEPISSGYPAHQRLTWRNQFLLVTQPI